MSEDSKPTVRTDSRMEEIEQRKRSANNQTEASLLAAKEERARAALYNQAALTTSCRWCGMIHGPRCPSVKVLEFHPDGTVRRVEFFGPNDCQPITFTAAGPNISTILNESNMAAPYVKYPKPTDAVIGIETIKALFVEGSASLCEQIELLLNSDAEEVARVSAAVGRAAREAMRAGR